MDVMKQLGYPAEEPPARPRKSADEVICFDRHQSGGEAV